MGSFAVADQWSTRSVFVSSTFLDMQAERDFLRDYTFPAVAEQLRAQGDELVAVDLRWGVETAGIADEAEREAHVLEVIRDEVLRCRPFLIVLLGDRYGWVPPPSQLRSLQTETQSRASEEGMSVTALEIELGAFAPEIASPRCYFYLRQPLPYGEMPPEVAPRFCDAYRDTLEAAALEEKLAALKCRIAEVFGPLGRVRSYTASWDPQAERVTGLEELGEMVKADLLAEFLKPAGAGRAVVSWAERERRALGEFAALKRSGFVGREQVLKDLTSRALALPHRDDRGVCVTGEAGSGKSVLWAALCARLASTEALLLASAAGVTPLSSSPYATLRRWSGELAAELDIPDDLPEGASPSQLRAAFAGLLAQVAPDRPVVIALDAINEMQRTPGARELAWLPDPLPDHCFLIATAVGGPEVQGCLRRAGVKEYPVPGLDEREAAAVVQSLCRKGGKPELNPDVREALLGKRRDTGAPAHLNPLWLTLAVEHLCRLGEDDFRRATQYQGRGDLQVVALLLDLVSQYPPEVAGMYDFLLTYAEGTFGAAVTDAYVSALTLSRSGWRETDLLGIVSALTGKEPDPLQMANLRRGLGMHLVRKGDPERYDLAHRQMREAVTARYLAVAAKAQRAHQAIVGYLQGLPRDDPLRQSELMHHLIGADDRPAAADYLTMGAQGASRELAWAALAEAIVRCGEATGNEAVAWALSLLSVGGYDDFQRPIRQRLLHQQFAFELAEAIERQGGSTELAVGFLEELLASIRREDLDGLQAAIGELLAKHTGMRPESLQGTVQSQLAQMQERAGHHEAAMRNAQEAVEFLQSLYDANKTPAQALLLRVAVEARADLLHNLGRSMEAGGLRRRALELRDAESDQQAQDERRRVTAVASRIQELMAEGRTLTALVASRGALEVYEENATLLDAAFLGESWDGSPESQVRGCAVIGELLMSQKEHREKAKAYLQKGIEVGERLYYDDQDASHAYDLAGMYARQVKLLHEDGSTAEAAAFAERELALMAALAAGDPSVARKSQLAGAHLNLGTVLLGSERKPEGQQHLEEAEKLLHECYCAAPSADSARSLAKCYMARAACLEGSPAAGRYLKGAKDLFEGLAQSGLGNADDLLLAATLQAQLAREGQPADTEGLATIEPLGSAQWAQSFSEKDTEEATRREFNAAALEVQFVCAPSAERGRPLLETYVRLLYLMATSGQHQKAEQYVARTRDLVCWAREHGLDLGSDVAGVERALETRPGKDDQSHDIPGCVLMGGVWLREPIALALQREDEDTAYLELARVQEQIARQGGLEEGLQLCLVQQATLLASQGRPEECLEPLAKAERVAAERGDSVGLAEIFRHRARVLAVLKKWTAAQQAWVARAQVLREHDDTEGWFSATLEAVNIALLDETEGDIMPLLAEAEQVARRLGRSDMVASFCGSRGVLLGQRGQAEEALAVLREATTEARAAGDRQLLVRCLINQAQVLVEQLGRPEDAQSILQEAAQLADDVQDTDLAQFIESLGQRARERCEQDARRAAAHAESLAQAKQMLAQIQPPARRFAADPTAELAYALGEQYYDLIGVLQGPAWAAPRRAAKRCLLALLEWLAAHDMDLGEAEVVLQSLRIELAGEGVIPGELCDVHLA